MREVDITRRGEVENGTKSRLPPKRLGNSARYTQLQRDLPPTRQLDYHLTSQDREDKSC